MMTDLKEKLRNMHGHAGDIAVAIGYEAADRIEQLEDVIGSTPVPTKNQDDRSFWIQYGEWMSKAQAARKE